MITNLIGLIVLVAVVYLLVKPSSYGPSLVKTTTEAFAKIITYATTG